MAHKRSLRRPGDGGVPPGSTLGEVDVAIVVGVFGSLQDVKISPVAESAVEAHSLRYASPPEVPLSDLWNASQGASFGVHPQGSGEKQAGAAESGKRRLFGEITAS